MFALMLLLPEAHTSVNDVARVNGVTSKTLDDGQENSYEASQQSLW